MNIVLFVNATIGFSENLFLVAYSKDIYIYIIIYYFLGRCYSPYGHSLLVTMCNSIICCTGIGIYRAFVCVCVCVRVCVCACVCVI